MSSKRKNDDPESSEPASGGAFSGFQLPKAVKRQKLEKADQFKRASPSESDDIDEDGRRKLPKDFKIAMVKDNKWRLTAVKNGKKGNSLSNDDAEGRESDNEKETKPDKDAEDSGEDSELPTAELPLILQNRVPGIEKCATDEEKFSRDVAMRPEENSFSSSKYEEVPIEAFGMAMLRGMGYDKDKNAKIGRTNASVFKPVELLPRADRQGLGAKPVAPPSPPKVRKDGRKWINKPGESNKPRQMMRAKPSADGKVKHAVTSDDELIPVMNSTPRRDALVEIQSGKHKGLFGRITELSADRCYIRLNVSEEEISTSLRRIEVLDEYALPVGHPAFSTRHTSSRKSNDRSRDSSHRRPHKSSNGYRGDRSRSRSPKYKSDRDYKKRDCSDDSKPKRKKSDWRDGSVRESSSRSSQVPRIRWVVPHIRVRIVSKTLRDGRYYCKKGRVEDVVSPFEFLVVMDSGETIEGVRESDVETVAPKKGKRVMVVSGKEKGSRGILMDKDTKKNKAAVQLSANLDMLKCTLDDICEFVGSEAHDEDLH